MAKEKKEQTVVPELKKEHENAFLEYNGEQICLGNTSPETLQDLFSQDIWKYLFKN